MPYVYDPKHGPRPDAPRALYCRTHGWFVMPEDVAEAQALYAEHVHPENDPSHPLPVLPTQVEVTVADRAGHQPDVAEGR